MGARRRAGLNGCHVGGQGQGGGLQVRPCECTQPVREHGEQGRGGPWGCWHGTGRRESQRLSCCFMFSVVSAPQGQEDQSVVCPAPRAAPLGAMGLGLWEWRLLPTCGAQQGLHPGYVVSSWGGRCWRPGTDSPKVGGSMELFLSWFWGQAAQSKRRSLGGRFFR